MFNFMFKVRIALFDFLDLGAHSLKYPLDCSKREKKVKLETLEGKSRQRTVEILLTQKLFWPKAYCIKSYKNKRLSLLNSSHLLNTPSWTPRI